MYIYKAEWVRGQSTQSLWRITCPPPEQTPSTCREDPLGQTKKRKCMYIYTYIYIYIYKYKFSGNLGEVFEQTVSQPRGVPERRSEIYALYVYGKRRNI